MPLFEYRCKQCGKLSEVLIRSQNEKPVCECGSQELEKLISSFAVSGGESASFSSCSDGSCGLPPSPCASGMCGL